MALFLEEITAQISAQAERVHVACQASVVVKFDKSKL